MMEKNWETKKSPQYLFYCNISVNYPGVCGCPNSCNADEGKGQCVNGQCTCQSGWKGLDCGLADCASGNDCNNNGACENVLGIDQCTCHPEWTGPFCQTKTLPDDVNDLPFGQVLGPTYWHKGKDEYEDHHPIFNRSIVASIHINMPSKVLELVRSPAFLYNATYVEADMTFFNGNIKMSLPKIGIKCKGFSSRTYGKKSWKIDFNNFVPDRTFYGLKKLGLKSNSQDISLLRSFHETDLLRALGVPSARNSYARLFINDMDFGIFWLEEVIDRTWLKIHFGHKGNLYKVAGGLLNNLGSDPNAYKTFPPFNITTPSPTLPSQAYRLKYSYDESYKDLRDLCVQLNTTIGTSWLKDLEKVFDVDLFLRSLVVITAVANIDTLSIDGNNYMMWRSKGKNELQFITSDFDMAFSLDPFAQFQTPKQNYTLLDFPPLSWGTIFPSFFLPENLNLLPSPVAPHLLAIPEVKSKFISYYEIFLASIFNPKTKLIERMETFTQTVLSTYVKGDKWYTLDTGRGFEDYNADINQNLLKFVKGRMEALLRVSWD